MEDTPETATPTPETTHPDNTADTPTTESPADPTAETADTPTTESPADPTAETADTPTTESPADPTAETADTPAQEQSCAALEKKGYRFNNRLNDGSIVMEKRRGNSFLHAQIDKEGDINGEAAATFLASH